MKIVFLYEAPHKVHAAWAKSISAEFVKDSLRGKKTIPFLSRFVHSIKTYLQLKKTDMILCEGSSQILTAVLCKLFSKAKYLAIILSDPKLYVVKHLGFIQKVLYYSLLNYFDVLVPTSQMMCDIIPQSQQCKAKIVYPFSSLDWQGKRSSMANKIICAGSRVCYNKGTDLVVKMFKQLSAKIDAELVITGRMDDLPEITRERTQDVVLMGHIPEEEFKRIMLTSTVFVSLARIEPAGIGILDSMGAGVIPVVSQGTGFKDIVVEINPRLVVNNCEQATDIIYEILTDTKLKKTLSDRAVIVAKRYSSDKSIQQFKEIFQRLLGANVR